MPQGDVNKSLIRHKQQIFTYGIEEVVSLKSLHLSIGSDIDPVCPTSNSLNNIVIESRWMGAIDPVASKQAMLSCCLPGFVLVDYFGIQP